MQEKNQFHFFLKFIFAKIKIFTYVKSTYLYACGYIYSQIYEYKNTYASPEVFSTLFELTYAQIKQRILCSVVKFMYLQYFHLRIKFFIQIDQMKENSSLLIFENFDLTLNIICLSVHVLLCIYSCMNIFAQMCKFQNTYAYKNIFSTLLELARVHKTNNNSKSF